MLPDGKSGPLPTDSRSSPHFQCACPRSGRRWTGWYNGQEWPLSTQTKNWYEKDHSIHNIGVQAQLCRDLNIRKGIAERGTWSRALEPRRGHFPCEHMFCHRAFRQKEPKHHQETAQAVTWRHDCGDRMLRPTEEGRDRGDRGSHNGIRCCRKVRYSAVSARKAPWGKRVPASPQERMHFSGLFRRGKDTLLP